MPYWKSKHKLGTGTVGLDIGPSTISVVSIDNKTAELHQFCTELEDRQKDIRRLQRKQDRQRRANNPDNFDQKGRVKARSERKAWKKSARQKATQEKIAELKRREAAYRKSLHGALVNHILSLGNQINLEKLSYRSFQRMYGKSVGFRAPGMFVELLRRKAASAAAEVNEFPTWSTRLSSICHSCGTVEKKPLSVRWHECECGVVAQRDLYSAFLACCVEGDRLVAGQAVEAWPAMDALLRAAASEPKVATGRRKPESFGGRGPRSQSHSSANTECKQLRPLSQDRGEVA